MLSHGDAAGFRLAVSRLSEGRVRVPEAAIARSAAVSFWRDTLAVFEADGPQRRRLADQDFDMLRSRAWFHSRGRIDLAGLRLDLRQALAAWRMAGQLGEWAGREAGSQLFARAAKFAVVAGGAVSLAACTTLFGGNVKGNFACSAPGGTCAPSTTIDDEALSVIQNARPMTPTGSYGPPASRGTTGVIAYAPAGSGGVAAAGKGTLHRDRRVLRVVFPSYVDGRGNLHEARVVHTVTDNGGWVQLSAGEANLGEQAVGRADARERAEVARGLTPLALPAAAPGDGQATLASASGEATGFNLTPGVQGSGAAIAGPQLAGPVSGPPSAAAVEAARRRGPQPGPNPLDAIKARVAAQLGQPGAPGAVGPGAAAPPPAGAKAAEPAAAGEGGGAAAPTPTVATNRTAVIPTQVEE
ncbi:MAG: hypothetical protein EBR34_08050 [Sphingomonadaceae bacterium]|nr:hypothetical protein [Sphingomonadaceae bacterium]